MTRNFCLFLKRVNLTRTFLQKVFMPITSRFKTEDAVFRILDEENADDTVSDDEPEMVNDSSVMTIKLLFFIYRKNKAVIFL